MENKTTGDLSHDLMSEANIDSYLHDNQPFFANQSIAELLAELYEKKDFSKAALVYLHQVFAGRRNPSRDRLLCLCVGLETTLEEAQRLLKQAGYAPLYPRLKRDAIISFGIVHHMELGEINDKLFAENEKTLY